MSLDKFLVANFRTGFDEALEPWLLPRDAFQQVKNSHLYRGVVESINGYSLFAEMTNRKMTTLTGTIDGVNTVFTGSLSPIPVSSNTVIQATVNLSPYTAEIFTDDGDGVLVSNLGGIGTINYTTGAVSVTFNTAPVQMPGGGNVYNAVIVMYDYVVISNPIMGIKQYYDDDGNQKIIVFDTRRMGIIVPLIGTQGSNVGLNYSISEVPHEYMVSTIYSGAGPTFTGNFPVGSIVPGTFTVNEYNASGVFQSSITENGEGGFTGNVTSGSYINYSTGDYTITYNSVRDPTHVFNATAGVYGDVFSGDFTNFFTVSNYQSKAFFTNNVDAVMYYDGTMIRYLNTNLSVKLETASGGRPSYDISRCLHLTTLRERLILMAPLVNGSLKVSTNYWSVAVNPLDFTNDEFLEAPTSQPIRAFGIINNELIVRFANSERIFRYTSDAFAPFRWDSTNNVWACDARYSPINYDSFVSSVGKPAIVGSDGVNVQRVDEIIPDFTLNARIPEQFAIVSMDTSSIGQCYGERFDDFKEGWLCYREFEPDNTGIAQPSNAVLAYNYLDQTYAVYQFPFSCLGFGILADQQTWDTTYDIWDDANFTWDSYTQDQSARINLGGDQFGKVYELGESNSLGDSETPVCFDVITKTFNPFIEQGQMSILSYVDFLVSATETTKLRIQFYINDEMYLDVNEEPAGYYQETTLTFSPTTSNNPSPQSKVWKRVYVGALGKSHTLRFYQNPDDFTVDTLNQPVKLHAYVLYMKPAGRIFN